MNPGCHPSLFFLAMFHTNSIITVAGLPRMSLQTGLSNVAAYFAIVRLLGPCRVGAVYKKHQQSGKGSHDDLLSLCCDGGHYCVGIWRPPTIPSHVRLRQPFRTKSNWGPQLMEQYWCNLENLAAPFLSRAVKAKLGALNFGNDVGWINQMHTEHHGHPLERTPVLRLARQMALAGYCRVFR
jgi:hypothetical protein